MKTWKQIALITAAVAVSAAPALAGTKYATNLVSSSNVFPAANPTLSPKSQIKLSDKGTIQIGLAGVTDGTGAPYTSTSTFADTGTLDGTEHIVMIKLYLPAVAMLLPEIDVPVPVVVSGGKGKAKLSVGPLLSQLGATSGRSVEVTGSEVWVLNGVNVAACQAIIDNSIPITSPPDTSCRDGVQLGISGLFIPVP